MAIVLSGSVAAAQAPPNPTVQSVDPSNGTNDVPVNKVIKVNFNEPVIAGTAYNNITVRNGAGTAKGITKTLVDNVLTITANVNYIPGDTNTLYIPINAITDLNGNGLTTATTSTFTTQLPVS
jgi:hypothetical protein